MARPKPSLERIQGRRGVILEIMSFSNTSLIFEWMVIPLYVLVGLVRSLIATPFWERNHQAVLKSRRDVARVRYKD